MPFSVLPRSRRARWRFAVLLSVFFVLAGWHLGLPAARTLVYTPQEGDLVFQSLPHNPLIDAIEGCTGSPYSHCGIVARRGDKWVVVEAVGPVKETPLFSWIRQGRRSGLAVYRLTRDLERIPALIAEARAMVGRPYDIHYALDDGAIYCSELIWKAWNRAGGTPLGSLTTLGDLNWRPHEAVIRRIENGGLPLDRPMITPVEITRDPRLTEILRQGF
ncbi:MAG: YiiX/YebB-like N1pC/P60 family cysteine hydrolase [Verrucomicrobiales bacterium]